MDQRDLVLRHVDCYAREPWRGYGVGAAGTLRGLKEVAEALRRGEEEGGADPTAPARAAFGGGGSYGNGAAMRAHPVALAHRAVGGGGGGGGGGAGGDGGGGSRAELESATRDMATVTHAHKGMVLGEGGGGKTTQPILVSLWAHCRHLGCSKGCHITNMSLI